jgi:valyl-tRNA synthetase
MESIRDWCISRQIWWGHRIPAWYCDDCREIIVSRETPLACPGCNKSNLRQDEDVLDTWFSSALWPFSTLGWPHKTPEIKKFYPTSVLVTGFDIIFFWVARMIMMGTKFMNDVPFKDVYIHALVRDLTGQKMSKSKGNVIDPLDMMHKYGTDAFRFTLTAFAAQGRDVKFSEQRVEGYRHFVNKLWNASRFILLNAGEVKVPDEINIKGRDIGSRWILSRLSAVAEEVNQFLEEYRFNDAASSIYQFVWHELCDWYIEMVKPVLYGEYDQTRQFTFPGKTARASRTKNNNPAKECLIYVLENTLRLLHPFMPYVTEEIWQALPQASTQETSENLSNRNQDKSPALSSEVRKSIVVSRYPKSLPRDLEAESEMAIIMETVMSIRTIRGELNLSPALELKVYIKALSDRAKNALTKNMIYIKKLAKADIKKLGTSVRKPKGSASAVRSYAEVYIPIEGLLNIELELERLKKEEANVERTCKFLNKKLLNEDFLNKAPRDVVLKEKEKYDECLKKRERIRENIKKLDRLGDKK